MIPFVTADQIVCHLLGDFFLQSDWMAANKYSRISVAFIHAIAYTIPFLALTQSFRALTFICVTHALIDHFKLAPCIAWVKNFIAPPGSNFPWKDCKATGYNPERPVWLTVWLMIVVDNTLHLICNAAALRWLA